MVVDSLQHNSLGPGQASESRSAFKSQGNRCRALQLIDSGYVDISAYGHLRADRRNEDHVSGKQLNIVRFIASLREVVNIELAYNTVASALSRNRPCLLSKTDPPIM